MMTNRTIDRLVEDLTPVKPIQTRTGLALTLVMAAACAVTVAMLGGIRADLLTGFPHPMFFLRGGLLLLLGMTSSYAVLAMAQPAVGPAFKGWIWALIAAALFPATALAMAVIGAPDTLPLTPSRSGLECLAISLLAGTGIATAQVLWLRRGAPVAPHRAGWLVGMASGALGAAAYSLHCPYNSIVYIGFWYPLAVAVAAILGRLIVPRVIRW